MLHGGGELALIVELGTDGHVTVGRVLSGDGEVGAVASDLQSTHT